MDHTICPLPTFLLPLLLATAPAQVCHDRGIARMPSTWDTGPDLGCAQAPGWPWWHLHTPGHSVLVPRPGYRPGDTRMLPRVLVHYRCTGWLLLPVVVDSVRTMGQVGDTDERPCVPGMAIAP